MDQALELVTAVLIVVVLTFVAFVAICWANWNPKAREWNALNIVTAVNIALTMNSLLPQYFVQGRSPAQCYFLHHWSGSFYHVTNGVSRCYFLARSNQVVFAPSRGERVLSRLLMAALVVLVVLSVVGFNMNIDVMIIPVIDICIASLNPNYAFFFSLLFPLLIELLINVRFVRNIIEATRATRSEHHSRATMRLLRITCVICLLRLLVFVIDTLLAFRLIPVNDPALLTAIFAFDQAYNACAMAWPTILIRGLKSCQYGIDRSSKRQLAPSTTAAGKPNSKETTSNVATTTNFGTTSNVATAPATVPTLSNLPANQM